MDHKFMAIEKRINSQHKSNILYQIFGVWKKHFKYSKSKRNLEIEHLKRKNQIDHLLGRFSELSMNHKQRTESSKVNTNGLSNKQSPRQIKTATNPSVESSKKLRDDKLEMGTVNTIFKSNGSQKFINSVDLSRRDKLTDRNEKNGIIQQRVIIPQKQTTERIKIPIIQKKVHQRVTSPEKFSRHANSDNDQIYSSRKEKLLLLKEKTNERIQMKQKDDQMAQQNKIELERRLIDDQRKAKLQQLSLTRMQYEAMKRPVETDTHFLQQMKRARYHYHHQLLVSKGFGPWTKLVQLMNEKMNLSSKFYRNLLLKRYFCYLCGYAKSIRREKRKNEMRSTSLAITHYRYRLCQKILKYWKKCGTTLAEKETVVVSKISRLRRIKLFWIKWDRALENQRRMLAQKSHEADTFRRRWLKRCCFDKWIKNFEECRIQHEVDRRTDKYWLKVQSWLKDI